MITDPARNRFLVGLGSGLIIGSLAVSTGGYFPTLIVAFGAGLGVLGVTLSFYEERKNG